MVKAKARASLDSQMHEYPPRTLFEGGLTAPGNQASARQQANIEFHDNVHGQDDFDNGCNESRLANNFRIHELLLHFLQDS